MSELDRARAMVARCEEKLERAGDEGSKLYYRLCLAGWRRWLEKLGQENAPGSPPGARSCYDAPSAVSTGSR